MVMGNTLMSFDDIGVMLTLLLAVILMCPFVLLAVSSGGESTKWRLGHLACAGTCQKLKWTFLKANCDRPQ